MRRFLPLFFAVLLLSSLSGCGLPGSGASPAPSVSPSAAIAPTPSPTPAPDPIRQRLERMSDAEKLGQMVIAGLDGTAPDEALTALIQNRHAGGVILFGDNIKSASQLTALTSGIKALNSGGIPLLISIDEEGGTVSRLPSEIVKLPTARTVGKKNDPELCRSLGLLLAERCSTFGINMDFAPVLDIYSNPKNTVIGARAFGSDAGTVAALGPPVMEGLAEGGVIPVVKHFPGHGDTAVDSHYGLPVVTKTEAELEQMELLPFSAAVEQGADAVMVAHILMRKLDPDHPASLSKTVVTGLLREKLGFSGVAVTDDLTMGAISENYGIGEAAVLAANAGCDLLLVCHGYDNANAALDALSAALKDGTLSRSRVDESVYRILTLKAKYRLTDTPVSQADIAKLNAQAKKLFG